MLRIFFLVFSQLTVGGLAMLHVVPAQEIGKGFFRTCASIYLLLWLLILAGLDRTRPAELFGCVLFTLVFLLYWASLWSERLSKSAPWLPLTWGVGGGAVVASALSAAPAASWTGEGAFYTLNFLLSTASLGAAMSGMLLGHWYLVTPELSLVPIKRMTGILLGSLLAQAGLLLVTVFPEAGLVPAGLTPKIQHLMLAYPYFLWGRALVGLASTFALAALTLWLLREGSTQAATGFLYTAVLTVTVGELIARFLFRLTGVPV
jgi:hypothetical protein